MPLILCSTLSAELINFHPPKYVSKINFWEIALKYSIGKLKLEGTTPEEILNASRESGFKTLDIAEDDIVTSHLLPFIAKHRDSFDRLIPRMAVYKKGHGTRDCGYTA